MAICDLQGDEVRSRRLNHLKPLIFPQKFTITLPKTNIFAPEKWLVGKRSGFLLGVSAYFQGTNMLVLGSRNLSSDVSFEVDHILGACLFLAC